MKPGSFLYGLLIRIWNVVYRLTLLLLSLLSYALLKRRNEAYSDSVLHISYMVHVPYYMVKTLRKTGIKADYMAIGSSLVWDKCDYAITYSKWPHIRALQEVLIFWKVVSKYEIIHSHFMIMLTNSGWELPVLKGLAERL